MSQKGFVQIPLLIISILVIAGAGAFLYMQKQLIVERAPEGISVNVVEKYNELEKQQSESPVSSPVSTEQIATTTQQTNESLQTPTSATGPSVIPKKVPSPSAGMSGYSFVFSGAVFDSTNAGMSDGSPLSNVTISVTGPRAFTTKTQSNGKFTLSLSGAPVGTYTICVAAPNGLTFPSAGDPPCEEVAVELLTDGTTLVFTHEGNRAYYTGTMFNFYGIRKSESAQVTAPNLPQNCISNPSPIFTNHITDMSAVNYVVAPPTMGSGPSLKTHGYIGTEGANVPVYAPMAMTIKNGSHYVGGPYMFEFQASCEVTVRFGHMTNPVDSIKKLLPAEPKEDSRTQELSGVSFAAGELIGYTVGTSAAGNWDFGVYNSTVTNRYAQDPSWNNSSVYTTAVCPFDYFAPDLKAEYVAKFDSQIMGGNPPHGESFCQ